MSRADKMLHIRMDAETLEIAKRRAAETDRGNMTAYIYRLVREDGERNPKKGKKG